MTKEEFLKQYETEEDTMIFEPWEYFCDSIIGITENHCQIIYSYEGMIQSLAKSYEKEYYEQNTDKKYDSNLFSDFLLQAVEWIEYNVIRSLPYWNAEFRPIIMLDVEK